MTEPEKKLPPPPDTMSDLLDEMDKNMKGLTLESLTNDVDKLFVKESTEDSRAENRVFAPKLPRADYGNEGGTTITRDTTLRDRAAAERTERPIVSAPSEGKVIAGNRIVCWVQTKVKGDHSLWVIRKAVGEWTRDGGDVWGKDYTDKGTAANDALAMSRKHGYKYAGIADWV